MKKDPCLSLTKPKPHIVMIPQRETVVKRIREVINNAERGVDIFLSWKRFLLGIFHFRGDFSEGVG